MFGFILGGFFGLIGGFVFCAILAENKIDRLNYKIMKLTAEREARNNDK